MAFDSSAATRLINNSTSAFFVAEVIALLVAGSGGVDVIQIRRRLRALEAKPLPVARLLE